MTNANPNSAAAVAVTAVPQPSSGSFESPTVDTAGLHGELHTALNASSDPDSILAQYREIVQRYTSAVGVGHI